MPAKTKSGASQQRLVQRLSRACKSINEVLSDTKKLHPKACLYLDATGNLNLLTGPHHDDRTNSDQSTGEYARFDRVIGSAKINCDSGDW